MKKLLYLAVVALLLTSCDSSEDEFELDTFVFYIDDKEIDLSESIRVSRNVLDEIEIRGQDPAKGAFYIKLKDFTIGVFTEKDYLIDTAKHSQTYSLSYLNYKTLDLYRYYQPHESSWFKINLKSFDNMAEGKVFGEFSGLLVNLDTNYQVVDSISVNNGIFSYHLESPIE